MASRNSLNKFHKLRFFALLTTFALLSACEQAAINKTELGAASRVITLAPNLTELVYTAGAGDLLVGVSAYSNYPPEAEKLPVVSDAFTVDQERLALLEPDLILAWRSGTPTHVVDELRLAGYTVEAISTREIEDISSAILRIGELTGRTTAAGKFASRFENSIAMLGKKYASRPPISVFFQVAARPLYTVNMDHYIGEVIELCGGRNVFEDLNELAPSVSVEAVIDRNPEVILAGSTDGSLPFDDWQRWSHLDANRYGNLFVVGADEIGRATTRLVSAAADICQHLEIGRENRRNYSE